MTLEPCEVGFQPLPWAAHGSQQKASRTEQDRPRLAPIIDGVLGHGNLVLQSSSGVLCALDESNFSADATRSLRAAVCRVSSVAAHWEYRINSLYDREKVRAFAMRHACTQP